MTFRVLVLGIALFLSLPALAQQQPSPSPPKPSTLPEAPQAHLPPPQNAPSQGAQPSDTRAFIKTHSDIVIVPVTVKDRQGQIVGDLQRDDFRVFQDGAEQQIARFSAEPFPLSAVVLIDNDLAHKQAEEVQKSLTAIAAGFGPPDEVALVSYAEFPETVLDFTFNNDDLFTQLKRVELNSHSSEVTMGPTTAGPAINGQPLPDGTGIPRHGSGRTQIVTSMDDAVYAAGQMLRGRGRDRRKIIFLISDGSNAERNQHNYEDTLRSLLEADVSVYAISVTHGAPTIRGMIRYDTSSPRKYADNTGGDTFYAGKAADLERLYSAVTEQARNEYIIAFSPQGTDHTRDFHSIEVRVLRPNLDILARQGYYTSAVRSVQ
jgi:VWFA-related protein